MDKIIGTWKLDDGQICSYFEDGTFTAQHSSFGKISGRYAFQNGYYFFESEGTIISAVQILSYDNETMRIGFNTGEIKHCQRINNDANKNLDFLPGDRVLLHSLNTQCSMNGSSGVIKNFDKASARYVVVMDETKIEKKIREANLKSPPKPCVARDPYVQKPPSAKSSHTQQQQQQQPSYLSMLNQQTEQLNQQNEQMLKQLDQYTEQLNRQNEQMMQQLTHQTEQTNLQTSFYMDQLTNMSGMGGFQRPQKYGGFGNMDGNSGGGNQFWNDSAAAAGEFIGEAAGEFVDSFEDPAAAGEFVGAAAGEFLQGVGFDIGGASLGALFGF